MQLGSEGLDRGSVGSFLAETLMVLSLFLPLNTGAGLGGLGGGGELRNQTWFLMDGVRFSLWSTQVTPGPPASEPQKAQTSLSLWTERPVETCQNPWPLSLVAPASFPMAFEPPQHPGQIC